MRAAAPRLSTPDGARIASSSLTLWALEVRKNQARSHGRTSTALHERASKAQAARASERFPGS